MKIIATILLIFCCFQLKAQYEYVGNDTVRVLFKASSIRYEHAQIIAKKGFVVRMIFRYMGDRMPCLGEDSECDYSDHHKTIAYLDKRKKEFDESGWHVWEVDIIKE